MGAPLLCADNIGSVILYPKATVTDQSGTTTGVVGFEPYRPFAGRRSQFNYWQPGTPNTLAWLQVQHEQPRTVTFLGLDRGHNLAGFPVTLLGSNDGSTFATIVNATIPTVTGGLLTSANGCLTEEGAWLIVPSVTSAYAYWRFNIPAMGANLQPTIPGLQFGLAYQPVALYRPYMEHRTQLAAQEVVSSLGWRGRGPRAFNRAGVLNLRADVNDYEYLLARLTVEEFFGSGRPMWVIQDQERPTEALQVIRPLNDQGFERPTQLYWPTAAIQVVEHEPLSL